MPKYFILLTKQKLNICILFVILLAMTVLKIFFLNILAIFFYFKIIYKTDFLSTFLLINI